MASGERFRVDVYGLQPFTLPFPAAVAPRRGEGLRVDVSVDYGVLFGGVDLLVRPERCAEEWVQGLLEVGV